MDRDHPSWLAHDRAGTGEPLVLVHGLGSRRQVWAPVFDTLTRHRDVIAVDLPGFGASPAGLGPATVRDLADRLAAFLAGLGVTGAHLAGSSLGGGIALELGRRGVARSVTAFAPVGFWGVPGLLWCRSLLRATRVVARRLGPAAPRLVACRPARAALFGAFYGRPARLDGATCLADIAAFAGAAGFDGACAALGRWRPPPPGTADGEALARIPVIIAWGTRDAVLPYRTQARRARAALPGARHVPLAGCGHLPFSDDPLACLRLLLDRND